MSTLATALAFAACTTRDTPPPPQAAPPAAATSLAADATPAAPPAARPLAETAEPEPAAVPPPTAPSPLPAFVLYSADRTLLLPLLAASPSTSAPGVWVLDDAAPRPAVRALFTRDPHGLAPCACPDLACSIDHVFEVDPDAAGPLCACLAPPPPAAADDDHGADGDADGASAGEDDAAANDAADACTEFFVRPVALFGGALLYLGTDHSTCGGLNIYDAATDRRDLASSATSPRWKALEPHLRPRGCTTDGPAGEPPDLWPLGDLECVRVGDRWLPRGSRRGDDPGECAPCNESHPEVDTTFLRAGTLYRVEDDLFHAGNERWVKTAPATSALCPDPADPCGDPSAFTAVPGAADFWIASDGAAALTLHRGALTLHLAGADPRPLGPLADLLGASDTSLLGVRYHADAARLRRALARAPRPAASLTCPNDHGCKARHGCAATCAADGRCADPGPATPSAPPAADAAPPRAPAPPCGPASPCPGDATCDAGRCRLTPRLDPADQPLVDAGGAGLGDRCVAHLRADRLAAALAACEAALARAPHDRARGAILYNLGRIAARIGDLDGARDHYRRSLAHRPNPTALAALAALDPHPAQPVAP